MTGNVHRRPQREEALSSRPNGGELAIETGLIRIGLPDTPKCDLVVNANKMAESIVITAWRRDT